MNIPFILLIDIFNVCIPTQNIQIVDEVNTVIAEGKAVELTDLLNKYGNNKGKRREPGSSSSTDRGGADKLE